MDVINNTKKLIDFFVINYISKVECAVDMTVGNGYDSKMILEKLSPKKLYCFDIQRQALINTDNLLKESYTNYELILDSHVNFEKYINTYIDLAIYNLGYLPNGDKNITTNFLEVKESLEKLLERLNKQGVVFITFYPGHISGEIESVEISKFLKNLDQKKYTVLEFKFKNQKNKPPYVVMIQKI